VEQMKHSILANGRDFSAKCTKKDEALSLHKSDRFHTPILSFEIAWEHSLNIDPHIQSGTR
jgi:hypothetical protein